MNFIEIKYKESKQLSTKMGKCNILHTVELSEEQPIVANLTRPMFAFSVLFSLLPEISLNIICVS